MGRWRQCALVTSIEDSSRARTVHLLSPFRLHLPTFSSFLLASMEYRVLVHCMSEPPPPPFCESPASNKETLRCTLCALCPSAGSFPNTCLLPASRKNLVLSLFHTTQSLLLRRSHFPSQPPPRRRLEVRFDISTSISSFDTVLFLSHCSKHLSFIAFNKRSLAPHTPSPYLLPPKRPSFRDHCRNSISRRAATGHQDMSRAGKLAPEVNR